MAGRSLRASKIGVQRAKQALMRRSLIQKSLVDEGIAAWATINKFFNGKPVARNLFLEICHRLDLPWEEIVAIPQLDNDIDHPEPKPNPPSSSYLTAVQQHSKAARTALIPRILERIPREIVQKKYLPAIARGVEASHQRVIPIIGPAGYGKSTILGDLYDELQQRETAWVGLILCSLLVIETSPSPQMLAIALGQAVSGEAQSITDLAQKLTDQHGRGVLLIDTLDLVISRNFVSAFSHLLRSLLNVGVTIVFTCRDHEYNDFLEPSREKLVGIAECVDRHTVPGFTVNEVCQAAISFFTSSNFETLEQGKAFADNILKLSADNRSLWEITQNPLLLALLCELFAKDGNVPADLTVSKLYKRYWHEKIAYSRVDNSHSSLLAIHKDELCLAIARSLFEMSQEKLIESAYRDDLNIGLSEPVVAAFDDLLSEGVLDRLPSQKIHFFHQTLLEYAIAYWLTRHTAQAQRQQWLSLLQSAHATRAYAYWYPVLRQHLTIVETDEEFEQLVAHLGTDNIGIFSAIAFAAASRDRPDALLNLLPVALELGESYQKRLRQALESAPRQLAEDVWSAMVVLLEQGSHATAVNTARTLNSLANRWWEVLGSRLAEAIAAVAKRGNETICNYPKGDQRIIFGWLLQDCLEHLRGHPDSDLFAVLRTYYPYFGSGTSTRVIQLYASTSCSLEEQVQLLQVMLNQPVPDNTELEAAILQFLVMLLTEGSILGSKEIWQSWLEVLHHIHPEGWDVLQARAIGCCAAADPALLALLVEDLLRPDHPEPRRNAIALSEAIRQGAADQAADALLQVPLVSLPPACFNTLAGFLRMQGAAFAAADQEAIAQQLQPFAIHQAERLRPVFDTLADTSVTARQLFTQLVAQLPIEKQLEYQGRLLRFLPIEQHPHIADLDKRSQLFLVKLYREQIEASPYALQQLLAAMSSKYKEVAVSASQDLDTWLESKFTVTDLVSLLRSPFPGVRVNGLKAIQARTQREQSLSASDLTEIGTALAQEDNQAVICLLCQIVAAWVQRYRQVPSSIALAVGGAIARLTKKKTLDGGSTRLLLSALKAIAQSLATGNDLNEAQHCVGQQLKNWIIKLLTEIDLIRVTNSESEAIELLSAAHRLDQTIISQLAYQECQLLAQRRWLRNISAVLKAVHRIENRNSIIFDHILASDWCSLEIESLVLEVKGI